MPGHGPECTVEEDLNVVMTSLTRSKTRSSRLPSHPHTWSPCRLVPPSPLPLSPSLPLSPCHSPLAIRNSPFVAFCELASQEFAQDRERGYTNKRKSPALSWKPEAISKTVRRPGGRYSSTRPGQGWAAVSVVVGKCAELAEWWSCSGGIETLSELVRRTRPHPAAGVS